MPTFKFFKGGKQVIFAIYVNLLFFGEFSACIVLL